MSARGRDRFRRDYPQRSEEKSHHGRTSAPPSRHLWVGNLPPDINEKILANLFLKFGELEDLAYQPGRSYAFINFKYDREAFAAVSELQGFVVGGNRLRIEFAKAEKSTASLRDEDFLQHRDERWSKVRESPLLDRDTRIQHPSPDHSGKRKISDRDVDPSEVLWIGFPALLKVDEVILRKAFSPFGEIEKITVFPGRSYAFVRFKTIMAAARAKETLQGKLFGNPRVHICFAKSESGSSNTGKNSTNFDPYGRSGFSEDLRHDRKFKGLLGDPTAISPRFVPNLELDEHDNIMGFPRNEGFEHRRFDGRPEMGFPHQGSPMRERRPSQFRDFLPQHFLHKGPVDEDDWDLPEDNLLFHGNPKKVKTAIFPLENELPEFPLPSFDQGKHALPREFPDFPRDSEPGMIGYKQIPDRAMNLTPVYGDRTDHRGSYNRFEPGSGPLPLNTVERKRFTPEPPRLSEEWKWEGIIAKGGTPVCRARCFPKGKVLDMPLPEFLDCTARTGLDMLAKHYYQAASTWVVFFVPESDADIGFYNEFMHYLEEKQRAAVAKLDEQTTLFLVPPSEFSETVLKIPGKLSISGVILRLDQTRPVQNVGFPQHPHIREPMSILPRHGDASYPKPKSPLGSFPSMARSGVADYMIDQRQNASGHNPNFGGKNVAPQSSTSGFDPAIQGYNPTMPRVVEETSKPGSSLQPEQLAQLASSLLDQPKQLSSVPTNSSGEDSRRLNAMSHSGASYNQGSVQQQPPNPYVGPQSDFQVAASQVNQSASSQDEEQDPQKRLQATLQLAAALLQQIQQGKGT